MLYYGAPLASDSYPSDPGYLKRSQEFSAWLSDLKRLKEQTAQELPGIIDVEKYLLGGTLMQPLPGGKIQQYAMSRNARPPYILVLFPEDRNLGPVWKERYGDFSNGDSVIANFIPQNELLIIRAEKLNPLSRSALLAHEGYHALFFSRTKNTNQTDEEYCSEEAIANIFEVSLIMETNQEFKKRVHSDGLKASKTMFGNDKRIKLSITIDKPFLDRVFGLQLSSIDHRLRATEYSHAIVLSGLRKHYKEEEDALVHFASYLCGKYKQMGVR
jgi:hypothetical protein